MVWLKGLQSFFLILFLLTVNIYAKPIEKVSLQLQWLHQFQFAGYYMAKQKGYYKESGLELEIKEWKDGLDVAQELRQGHADYGICSSSVLLNAMEGENILLLAAILQSSPLVIISKESSDIKSLKELKGKKIMSVLNSSESVSIKAMLRSQQLSFKDMKLQKYEFDLKDFVEGRVDLMTAYLTNEPFALKQMGIKIRSFEPKEYGFDFYSDILFTSKAINKKESQKIKAFTQASLKGWEYAFEHIDESVDLILEKYNSQNKSREALVYEARELKKLAYYKTNVLGTLEKDKLEKILFVYKLLGLSHKDIDIEKLIYKPSEKKLNLSEKEETWIKNHPQISYSEVNWKPLSIIENGEMKGIMGEYLKIVSEKTGIKFKYVSASTWPEVLDKFSRGEINLVPGVGSSEQEKALGLITDAYANYPMAIVTGEKYRYINNLKELSGKVVAVPKYFTSYNFLVKNYPEIKVAATSTIKEALSLVNSGAAEAFVGHIATSLYYMSEQELSTLKITGTADFNFEHHYLVHKNEKILASILNKTFATISNQDRAKINMDWVQNTVKEKKDSSLLVKILIALVGLMLFIVLLNYRLKSVVRNKTKELNELNMHLEEIVQDRTLKLEQSREKLQDLADHDPLTNLYNRRYLLNVSQELLFLARRNRTSMSVVMLDIDKFKEINDSYGHSVGDDVILCIVNSLNNSVRQSDIVARYGGEEFVVLFPETELKGAKNISEKIRLCIENDMHCANGKEIGFTASFGVSEVDLDNDSSIMAALERADKALYKAKADGRNMVQCN